jgi:hypothetical protein
MNTHVKIGKYEVHIPKLFTLLKWGFLLAIAITTALVGFMQSMLVSWLYMWRSTFIYSIVVRARRRCCRSFVCVCVCTEWVVREVLVVVVVCVWGGTCASLQCAGAPWLRTIMPRALLALLLP